MEIIDEKERKKTERRKGVAQAIVKVWELNGFDIKISYQDIKTRVIKIRVIKKFLANSFALSDTEDNTSGPLNRGGLADLPLLRTLSAICQKSWEPSDCNWIWTHNHLVHKRTLNHLPAWLNGWVFIYELSGCGFKSSCSHLTSDFVPASSKEFFDIQATIEWGFTLKPIHDMIRTYSHENQVYGK